MERDRADKSARVGMYKWSFPMWCFQAVTKVTRGYSDILHHRTHYRIYLPRSHPPVGRRKRITPNRTPPGLTEGIRTIHPIIPDRSHPPRNFSSNQQAPTCLLKLPIDDLPHQRPPSTGLDQGSTLLPLRPNLRTRSPNLRNAIPFKSHFIPSTFLSIIRPISRYGRHCRSDS